MTFDEARDLVLVWRRLVDAAERTSFECGPRTFGEKSAAHAEGVLRDVHAEMSAFISIAERLQALGWRWLAHWYVLRDIGENGRAATGSGFGPWDCADTPVERASDVLHEVLRSIAGGVE